jgi:hypothetical protein
MSTTAPRPVTTPIPVQLSEPEFDALILPGSVLKVEMDGDLSLF